ncbi:hypothetical protein JHN49_02215 [Streptomyces sp. MBT57]|nr:hypothetical protein [Streptomyces sp. MBT57]
MAKQTKFVTEKDLKQLRREVQVGTVLYQAVGIETKHIPWEDSQLLTIRTVTGRSWLVSDWIVDGAGTLADMLHQGPVYTVRPTGIRALREEHPQVAGPLDGHDRKFGRRLNESELTDLEAGVASTTAANSKAGRGKKSSWW